MPKKKRCGNKKRNAGAKEAYWSIFITGQVIWKRTPWDSMEFVLFFYKIPRLARYLFGEAAGCSLAAGFSLATGINVAAGFNVATGISLAAGFNWGFGPGIIKKRVAAHIFGPDDEIKESVAHKSTAKELHWAENRAFLWAAVVEKEGNGPQMWAGEGLQQGGGPTRPDAA